MQPIEFPERNDEIALPPGSELPRLPVHRTGSSTVSCWALTPQELIEIQNTGVIYLTVSGSAMPSIGLSGHYPFEVTNN